MSKTQLLRQRALFDWCTQHDMSPDALERLAQKVCSVYCKYRAQYAAGYRPSAAHADAWNDAAMALTEAGATPDTWVCAQFDEQENLPYPNNLHGKAATAAYRAWVAADSEIDIELQLRTYADIVKTWKAAHSVPSILTDPRHGFPPLFVWCISRVAKLPDITARVAPKARAQLARPAYRTVYRSRFPDLISATGEML